MNQNYINNDNISWYTKNIIYSPEEKKLNILIIKVIL